MKFFLFCCLFILSPFKTNSFVILLDCTSLCVTLCDCFEVYKISHVYLLLFISLFTPSHTRKITDFPFQLHFLEHFFRKYLHLFVLMSLYNIKHLCFFIIDYDRMCIPDYVKKASFRCSSFVEVVGIIVSFLSANRNNINQCNQDLYLHKIFI